MCLQKFIIWTNTLSYLIYYFGGCNSADEESNPVFYIYIYIFIFKMLNNYKKERKKESAPWREVERLALFDNSRKVTCNEFNKYSKTNNKYKTSLEWLKYISNIRTNWLTVQIPRCSLRFLLNAPMSAASTVSVGRLFHSFTILIKKEYLKQLTLVLHRVSLSEVSESTPEHVYQQDNAMCLISLAQTG